MTGIEKIMAENIPNPGSESVPPGDGKAVRKPVNGILPNELDRIVTYYDVTLDALEKDIAGRSPEEAREIIDNAIAGIDAEAKTRQEEAGKGNIQPTGQAAKAEGSLPAGGGDGGPPRRETAVASGGDEGGNDGRGGPPEESSEPPEDDPRYAEFIWSEKLTARGIELARQIVFLEGKENKERYNEQNGRKLNGLYKEWKIWVNLIGKRSIVRKPFVPSAELEESKPPVGEQAKIREEPETPDELLDNEGQPLSSVLDLYESYKVLKSNPYAIETKVLKVKEDLSRYFKEAKRLGLLDMVDGSLKALYVDIRKGLKAKKSPAKIRKEIRAEREEINELGDEAFTKKKRYNKADRDKLEKLKGVWEVYTDFTIDKFTDLLTIGNSAGADSIEGEFNVEMVSVAEAMALTSDDALREQSQDPEMVRRVVEDLSFSEIRDLAGGDEETFQKLIENDRSYLLQQFLGNRDLVFRILLEKRGDRRKLAENEVADLESARKMAQKRKLYWKPMYASYYEVTAKTPEEFQIALDTFTQWLRSGLTKSPNEIFQRVNGFKDALTTAGVKEDVPIVGYRQELEGLIGILGADFANEHYNAENYKQFLDFLAADEGPDRLIRLAKVSKGKVAAVLWKFDKDPKLQLLFAAQGSRGQLQGERDAIAQQELRNQIMAFLTEEILAVEIKGYDPRDPNKETSTGAREENLDEIAKFKSDEDFQHLFEGFDQENQDVSLAELKTRLRVLEIRSALAQGVNTQNFTEHDKTIYLEFKSKTDKEIELKPTERVLLKRLEMANQIRAYLQAGKDPDGLRQELGEDHFIMYETAKHAVSLAFEMYGAMGEKAKRGGASFLVDRTDSEDRKFVEYIQVNEAEGLAQFAESWVKATYGGELDPELQLKLGRKGLSSEEVKYRADQARKMAIWALKSYGRDAKLWDFTLLRNGKAVDPNTCGYSKYGTDESKTNDIEKYRYAVPNHPMILGFNSKGEPVTLVFDDDGKPVGLEYDKDGKAVIYDQAAEIAKVNTLSDNNVTGEMIVERRRQRIVFDNLDNKTKAQRMMLKTPIRQTDGTFKPGVKEVDLKTAISHLYSRRTKHPYPGYQEEDTALLTKPDTFAAARRIKNGQSRPEDEGPHATQLLMIDPTLERVDRVFNKETVEDRLILAAIEESYQSHWRVNDELYQVFLPDGPFSPTAKTVYGTQDFGGSTKMWFHTKALAARWPDMEARRLSSLVNVAPLHFGAMSDTWGADGVLDTIRMFGYKQYRIVGLFALQKWIAQTEGAGDVMDSLFGFRSPQEKRSKEGLFEKPTNDADKYLQQQMKKYYSAYFVNKKYEVHSVPEDVDSEFLNAVRGSLERLDVTMQRMRVLETDMRGERAPLWLEGIDIYERNSDGSIKTETEINTDGEIVIKKMINPSIYKMRDSGSGRHSESIFFWRFVNWLRSDKEGEGKDLYSTEGRYYAIMDRLTYATERMRRDHEMFARPQTRWEWLLGKIVR